MSILGSILGTVVDTVTLPVAVVKDIASLGGTLDGKNKSYTAKKIEDIQDDLDEVDEDIREL